MNNCKLLSLIAGLALAVSSHAALSSKTSDRIFTRLDQNTDTVLDMTEFARMMGETMPSFAGFSMRTYRAFFRADGDHTASITGKEFLRWIRGDSPELAAESVERFLRADRNNDKVLDVSELPSAYKQRLAKRKVAAAIKRLDINDDGKLSLKEFFQFLPMECKTFLGMKKNDADLLTSAFGMSSFVWRDDDVAYPYDPVFGEPQPLFFFGLNGGVITDCSMRVTILE
jgi:Ca2+-binding EF-hand superfamily protein